MVLTRLLLLLVALQARDAPAAPRQVQRAGRQAEGQHPALSRALWHPSHFSRAAVGPRLGLGLGPGEQLGWAGPGWASQAGTTAQARGGRHPVWRHRGAAAASGTFSGGAGGLGVVVWGKKPGAESPWGPPCHLAPCHTALPQVQSQIMVPGETTRILVSGCSCSLRVASVSSGQILAALDRTHRGLNHR